MRGKQCKKIRKAARQVPDLETLNYLRGKIKTVGGDIKDSPITLTKCYRKVVKILKKRFKKLNHTARATIFN